MKQEKPKYQFLAFIEYNGASFAGWQIQPNQSTIQGELEKALAILGNQKTHVRGSGRTDSGVHARGQVATFFLEKNHKISTLRNSINALVPKGISVTGIVEVPIEYDLKKDITGKVYSYRIHLGSFPPVLESHNHWWLKRNHLDLELVKSTSNVLIGRHDFKNFRAADCPSDQTIKEIKSLIIQNGPYWDATRLTFTITGSGFLKNMVRIIVGSLTDVGLGKLEPNKIGEALNELRRTELGITAPAHGLTLEKVLLKSIS